MMIDPLLLPEDHCHGHVYVDSCILIAWMNGEKRSPEDDAGLVELIDRFEDGSVHLHTSTISYIEALEVDMSGDDYEKFCALRQLENYSVHDVRFRIARIAGYIRSHYKGLGDGLPTVCSPDAIHLATAVAAGCSTVLTWDARDRKPQTAGGISTRGKRGLQPLSGLVAGLYRLEIVPPRVDRPQLGLDLHTRSDA